MNLLLWKSVAVGRHHDRQGHAHFARNHVVVPPSEGSDPNVSCDLLGCKIQNST